MTVVSRTVDEPGNGTLEIFPLPTDQATLLRLLSEVFEHWQQVRFGPIIQGAAYEIKALCAPRITLLDGYATLDFEAWHIHLCLGETAGDASNPTSKNVAEIRPCKRAELYRIMRGGSPVSWGLRLFNGNGDQQLTVLLPNPFLDNDDQPCSPDFERLALWDQLRLNYLSLKPDPIDRSGKRFVHG